MRIIDSAVRQRRRLEMTPLHHIDTSVILEPEKTENGRFCRRHLHRVGYKYRGNISFPVLSELFLVLVRIKDYRDKHGLFDFIDGTIATRKIGFHSPKSISGIVERIEELDSRITPVDREIVACAVEENASTLITLDKNLIHNGKIEEEFRIKIMHPKELL